ncbi:hypothetical protein ASPFODRAFT_34311 [Aspergillus luchuensis CBS 106.47]|uniref:Uncharacterized protein n=1 Tax=Aspergillus luchuensis (strain CBS 106.47) TaxID=1137211 RepID=A0A1M3TF87_ASPLC|nr:hypothetical protein ASPFODRAFT_34311 [Aspergillus luchuensis CBS 106.47]
MATIFVDDPIQIQSRTQGAQATCSVSPCTFEWLAIGARVNELYESPNNGSDVLVSLNSAGGFVSRSWSAHKHRIPRGELRFSVTKIPVFHVVRKRSNEEYCQSAFGPSCGLLVLECRGIWQSIFGVSLIGTGRSIIQEPMTIAEVAGELA